MFCLHSLLTIPSQFRGLWKSSRTGNFNFSFFSLFRTHINTRMLSAIPLHFYRVHVYCNVFVYPFTERNFLFGWGMQYK